MTVRRLFPLVMLALAACSANEPTTNPTRGADVAAAVPFASDWIMKTSPDDVPTTVARLTAAIEGAGARVVAVVDHQANAATADLELPPTTVVISGNPMAGTPLMQADRRVALDLPQKMLVWQEGETTWVGYLEPPALAQRYGIDPALPAVSGMIGAMDGLSDAAITP